MAGILLKNMLMKWIGSFRYLLWPSVCTICNDPITEQHGGMCRDCWCLLAQSTAGTYCRRCGNDVSPYAIINNRCGHCQQLGLDYEGFARAGVYCEVLRKMILAFKFQDRTELDTMLGMLGASAFIGSGFADEVDYLVPVPLHWIRRLWRGYNQSFLIARAMKSSIQINTDLVRIRYTQRQWNLTPAKRRKNVKGAFAVRRGHDFKGKRICLIDDITTSGATINECAKTLKAAGAEKVYILVIAAAFHDG